MKKKFSSIALTFFLVLSIVFIIGITASAKTDTIASGITKGTTTGKIEITNGVLTTGSKNDSFNLNTYSIDNSGVITISFDITPTFKRATNVLYINNTLVLSATADKTLNIAGTSKTISTTAGQTDGIFRKITVVLNPITGVASLTYENADNANDSDNITVTGIDVGDCLDRKFSLKIGSSASSQSNARLAVKNLLITQENDDSTVPVELYNDQTEKSINNDIEFSINVNNNSLPITLVYSHSIGKTFQGDALKINGVTVLAGASDSATIVCGTTGGIRTNKSATLTLVIDPKTGVCKGTWIDEYNVVISGTVNVGAFENKIDVTLGKSTVKKFYGMSADQWQMASGFPKISTTISDKTYYYDDDVYMYVSIDENSGSKSIKYLDIAPVYDISKFELVSATDVSGAIFGSFSDGSTQVLDSGNGGNGDIILYKFKVKDNIATDEYKFTVNVNYAYIDTAKTVNDSNNIEISSCKINTISKNGDVKFEGYQQTQAIDGTYCIRFVFSGNITKNISGVGATISTANFESGSNKQWDMSNITVYKELNDSIISGAPTAEKLGKDYVTSIVLTDIPESIKDIVFTVQPYIIINDENVNGVQKTVNFEYRADTLSIMSFNVKTGSASSKSAKTFALLEEYEPDVIGLQECGISWINAIKNSTYLSDNYTYVGTPRNGADLESETNEASPILYRKSRFSEIASGTLWLSETPTVISKYSGSNYYRVMTYAVLQRITDGQKFLFVNTHPGYESAENAYQTAKIVELTASLLKEYGDMPTVFTGDFNCVSTNQGYKNMINSGLEDARYIAVETTNDITFPDGDNSRIIDFIFVSKNTFDVQLFTVPKPDSSDHNPIYAEMTLKEK